jgi:hypothetical protein
MQQGFKADDVISKLRQLKLQYIQNNVGSDPARLPAHLSEFLGYATLLYDHYAEYIKAYEIREAQVVKEENDQRLAINEKAETRDDKVTVTEVEQRISVRLGDMKGERKRLELAVKGATLHINGCQSLIRNWDSEAKGVR